MYWRYEKQLRRLESRIGSTLGATGAIYAVRRSLWRPLPADTILDDVLTPMRVVLAGYRVVFNENARGVRSRRRQTPTPRRAARSGRSPATTRFSGSSRRCCCRGATRCGCSTSRTSSAGSRCRTRCWPRSRRASSWPAIAHRRRIFYGRRSSAQVLFYLLAGAGALARVRARGDARSCGRADGRARAPRSR